MTRFSLRRHGLLLAGALLVAASSVGAGGQIAGWWSRGEALPNEQAIRESFSKPEMDPATGLPTGSRLADRVDFDRARIVARTPGLVLVAVPQNEGGYCLTPSLEAESADADSGAAIVCDDDASGQTDVFVSWASTRTTTPIWVIVGRIADANAGAMSLVGLNAELQEGGFFMAAVPRDRWPELSGATVTLELIDSAGSRIRENCVRLGNSPDKTPPGGVSLFPSDLDTSPPCGA